MWRRKRLKPNDTDLIWGLLFGLIVLGASVIHTAFKDSAWANRQARALTPPRPHRSARDWGPAAYERPAPF